MMAFGYEAVLVQLSSTLMSLSLHMNKLNLSDIA